MQIHMTFIYTTEKKQELRCNHDADSLCCAKTEERRLWYQASSQQCTCAILSWDADVCLLLRDSTAKGEPSRSHPMLLFWL